MKMIYELEKLVDKKIIKVIDKSDTVSNKFQINFSDGTKALFTVYSEGGFDVMFSGIEILVLENS